MTDLQAARERTVRDHMALENALDWDAVIATFQHPDRIICERPYFDARAIRQQILG